MKIYTAMPAVMKDVGAVEKSRKNPQQGYMFRGIDEVYEHCQLVLAKHGVFVVPYVVEREREERETQKGGSMFSVRLLVDHFFYAEDGSYVTARTLGEAMDSGDKASNKAMSAAMKYALVESLCIPTRDPKDTEDESPEVLPRKPPQQSAPPPPRPAVEAEEKAAPAFITPAALTKLQTVVGKLGHGVKEADEAGLGGEARVASIRTARLRWISGVIDRIVTTARELTTAEADKVIAAAEKQLAADAAAVQPAVELAKQVFHGAKPANGAGS